MTSIMLEMDLFLCKMHVRQTCSRFSFSVFYTLLDRELREDYEYHVPVSQNPFLAELSSKYSEGVKNLKK